MPRLPHDRMALDTLRRPTEEAPWRVLVSGCIAGWGCGVDGTSFGMDQTAPQWLSSPKVVVMPFCPEDVGLGTPRKMPDIHGGDGNAVLEGTARVLDPDGVDLTAAMIRGGQAMVDFAVRNEVDLAVLTDMSAACGTQVISLGCRFDEPRRYQQGVGVAAAMLLRVGVSVVSQRDFRTLARLGRKVNPKQPVPKDALDHHEHPWTVETFGASR